MKKTLVLRRLPFDTTRTVDYWLVEQQKQVGPTRYGADASRVS